MKKRHASQLKPDLLNWTTDHDCYLIEHNSLSLEELCQHLPYSEEQIQDRKIILGLTRRDRQMRRFL